MSTLWPSASFVALMGVFAGSVYVLGFTLLHENVDDELRGRVFAGLYTLVRLCVLISFAVGGAISDLMDGLSQSVVDGELHLGIDIAVPGVRLTLWLAGTIMVIAGVLAAFSLRAGATQRAEAARGKPHERARASEAARASERQRADRIGSGATRGGTA